MISLHSVDEIQRKIAMDKVINCITPERDITLSINFWLIGAKLHGMGFVRETKTTTQPEGVDVFKMPASLFIRAYTDKESSKLLGKEQCEIWELFAYIRNYVMPSNGYKMADNGAQELEVYDTKEHKMGYAYVPVMRV